MTTAIANPALDLVDAWIELLSDEKRWTKGISARDAYGIPVTFSDARACSWCIAAGYSKVSSDYEPTVAKAVRLTAWRVIADYGYPYSASFNDDEATTHADIMNYLSRVRELVAQAVSA